MDSNKQTSVLSEMQAQLDQASSRCGTLFQQLEFVRKLTKTKAKQNPNEEYRSSGDEDDNEKGFLERIAEENCEHLTKSEQSNDNVTCNKEPNSSVEEDTKNKLIPQQELSDDEEVLFDIHEDTILSNVYKKINKLEGDLEMHYNLKDLHDVESPSDSGKEESISLNDDTFTPQEDMVTGEQAFEFNKSHVKFSSSEDSLNKIDLKVQKFDELSLRNKSDIKAFSSNSDSEESYKDLSNCEQRMDTQQKNEVYHKIEKIRANIENLKKTKNENNSRKFQNKSPHFQEFPQKKWTWNKKLALKKNEMEDNIITQGKRKSEKSFVKNTKTKSVTRSVTNRQTKSVTGSIKRQLLRKKNKKTVNDALEKENPAVVIQRMMQELSPDASSSPISSAKKIKKQKLTTIPLLKYNQGAPKRNENNLTKTMEKSANFNDAKHLPNKVKKSEKLSVSDISTKKGGKSSRRKSKKNVPEQLKSLKIKNTTGTSKTHNNKNILYKKDEKNSSVSLKGKKEQGQGDHSNVLNKSEAKKTQFQEKDNVNTKNKGDKSKDKGNEKSNKCTGEKNNGVIASKSEDKTCLDLNKLKTRNSFTMGGLTEGNNLHFTLSGLSSPQLRTMERTKIEKIGFNSIPFIVGRSISKSHHLGINIQHTLSLFKRCSTPPTFENAYISKFFPQPEMNLDDSMSSGQACRSLHSCPAFANQLNDECENDSELWSVPQSNDFLGSDFKGSHHTKCSCLSRKSVNFTQVLNQLLNNELMCAATRPGFGSQINFFDEDGPKNELMDRNSHGSIGGSSHKALMRSKIQLTRLLHQIQEIQGKFM